MTLLLRTDEGAEIGSGHAMRCLALAQAWKDEGRPAHFVMASAREGFRRRLREEGMAFTAASDAEATCRVGREVGAQWIVLDGYDFAGGYQRALREAGFRVLVIDDTAHADGYSADLILNQNPYAHEGLYARRESDTQVLAGTRYALLRRMFRARPRPQAAPPEVARRLLVTFGGGDSGGATDKVLEALRRVRIDGVEVVVVAGAADARLRSIPRGVRLERDVEDMAGLMEWAEAGFCSSGSTLWELAYMGVACLTVTRAPNQGGVARWLSEAGAVRHLGELDTLTPEEMGQAITEWLCSPQRRKIAAAFRALVDGEGASRVAMRMSGERLRLRRVRPDDRQVLWEWANEPETRRLAFHPEPISWERHVEWFATKLADPRTLLLLGVDAEDRPIGQIRFDGLDGEPTASISIAPERRGQGLGGALLRQGCRALRARTVHAYVKLENAVSKALFEHAGFQAMGETEVRGQRAVHYARRADSMEAGSAASHNPSP